MIINQSSESEMEYEREARRLEQLVKHPQIVHYEISWIENGHFYILMEFCHANLFNFIECKQFLFSMGDSNEKMKLIKYFIYCEIFKELIEAVQFLHDQVPPIVHYDIKPKNILFGGFNGKVCIKLCDFGLSRNEKSKITSGMVLRGTVGYIAPEMVNCDSYTASTKCDIYSLGKTAFQLFDDFLENNSSSSNIFDSNMDNYFNIKLSNLNMVLKKMINEDKNLRPNCKQIIDCYFEWNLKFIPSTSIKFIQDDQEARVVFIKYIRQKMEKHYLNINTYKF